MNLWKPSTFPLRLDADKAVTLVVLSLLAGISGAARAQSTPLPVKSGLWEMQVSVTSKMALPPEVEAKIAAMPQAQQDQMRAMMGSSMPGSGAPMNTTRQVCLAPQMSMDSMLSQAQQQSAAGMKCTFSNKKQSATGASLDISCTGSTGSAAGTVQWSMSDAEHVSSSMHMTVTASAQGHTMNTVIDSTTSGKFVNADCGTVKPFTPPAGN